MDKIYFISVKGEKLGPLSFEELTTKEIDYNTLIWKNGWDNWKKVNEVEELKELIISEAPKPPVLPNSLEQKVAKTLKLFVQMILISLGLSLFVFILIYLSERGRWGNSISSLDIAEEAFEISGAFFGIALLVIVIFYNVWKIGKWTIEKSK